jgi:hypothetical protein
MGAGDRASGSSQVKQGLEQVRQKASEGAKEAKHRGKERLEKGKDAAADQVGQLAGAVEDVASKLGESNSTFASYASDLGHRISTFADGLHNRSIDDIVEEVRSLARRNPTLFLAGSVALGIAVSRFLKASARRARNEQQGAGFDYQSRTMRDTQGTGLDDGSFVSGSPSPDSLYRDRPAPSGEFSSPGGTGTPSREAGSSPNPGSGTGF